MDPRLQQWANDPMAFVRAYATDLRAGENTPQDLLARAQRYGQSIVPTLPWVTWNIDTAYASSYGASQGFPLTDAERAEMMTQQLDAAVAQARLSWAYRRAYTLYRDNGNSELVSARDVGVGLPVGVADGAVNPVEPGTPLDEPASGGGTRGGESILPVGGYVPPPEDGRTVTSGPIDPVGPPPMTLPVVLPPRAPNPPPPVVSGPVVGSGAPVGGAPESAPVGAPERAALTIAAPTGDSGAAAAPSSRWVLWAGAALALYFISKGTE